MALNVPIAVSMGLATFLAILLSDITVPSVLMAQRVFATLDSFPFMAVPFFILSGTLMEHGGMSRRLIDLAKCIVGGLAGGLAYITVLASAFFGALTGSAAATVAAIGGIMIPSMKKEKYPADFAAATAAASGTLGVVLPPSVPMVTYAVIANVSVGSMFMGGFIPGFLMVISLLLTVRFMSRKMEVNQQKSEIKLGTAFVRSIGALMMPVIILGGIYSGFSTPTEAAAIAVVYAFIVGMFGYKEIKWKNIPNILISSGKTTAMVMFIVGMSGSFSWLLTSQRIPYVIAYHMLGFTTNFFLILLLVNIMLLVTGMVIETNALILMLAPILLPIVSQIGYNPIAFGLIMVINTSVGKLIPPMALNIMVASSISGLSIETIARRAAPFLIGLLSIVLLVSFVPEILLFLPRILGMPV